MNRERYQRQIILAGFGEEAQQRLNRAKVLVIGAGGLGCPALQYLVAAGVGSIGIADHDIVELSNLQRQVLYGLADLGELKVNAAAKQLQHMNPEVELVLHPTAINKKNILQTLKNYDIIFDGTDNFESRYLINDACVLLKKPLVFAAVSGFEGQLAVFNVLDKKGIITNYRDLFPIQPEAKEIPNCAENGIIGVIPGIIGTMAAGEIIKLITGIGETLSNKLLHYNMLNQGQYQINISPSSAYKPIKSEIDLMKKDYKIHNNGYLEIDVEEMTKLSEHDSTLIVDVRERHEFPKLNTNIYKQAPMSEFDDFIQSNISQRTIILLCQHGIRSIAAAELLHQKYGESKKIYSLKGGISKWRNHFLTT
ncbi:ThiF family adenylyltransferase [Pedobacter jamesrossensis]|uniref:ThiF family adenylyltransferase n=1 Tax=Pedobacter jamesrossensis TaxID=1908238 RepID=A0ABV8NTG2_9SPHI